MAKKNKYLEEWIYENDITITRYLADGLLAFNSENRLFFINPAAEKLLEVNGEEVTGLSVLEVSRFARFFPLISLLGGSLEEISKKELEFSENLVLEISSIHMKLEGERVSTLVVLHDITREKQVDKMKSEFISLAVHQLRTPISGIKWSLEGLLGGDFGKINKEQKEIIERTLKVSDKMIVLMDRLLNVSEIEEGGFLKKRRLLSLEDLIKSVAEKVEPEIKKKNIQIKLEKPKEDLPKVMVDEERMNLALRSIIDNAVRYTFGGGLITISLTRKEKHLQVEVKDTGIGIPFSQQDKIFDKFFRGSNIMKIDEEGAGLGLYLAKSIIEAHNGRIWFESEENKGTTFYFTIPIKKKYAEFLTKEFY